jgi:hypothetical protein
VLHQKVTKILRCEIYFISNLGFFIHDPRITLENDEITLDFGVMKRCIKLLISCEEEISLIIHKSLDLLLKQIRNELTSSKQSELENDANFLNIFFIIFQLPFLSDPNFIFDVSHLFYSILTQVSVQVQAKFVRLLSKYTNNLKDYISHVQQYITLHTLQWCDHVQINSDNEQLLSNEPGDYLFISQFEKYLIITYSNFSIDITQTNCPIGCGSNSTGSSHRTMRLVILTYLTFFVK